MKLETAIPYLRPNLSDHDADVDLVLSGGDEPVLVPWRHGLLIAYLMDGGDSFLYAQNRHLAEAYWTFEALHQKAIENLSLLATEKLQIIQQSDIFSVLLDGNFEASLLLVDELWNRDLRHLVHEGYLACAPSRDVLAFCDSSSESGIRQLQQVVARVWPGGDHLLIDDLLIRDGISWRRLEK